MDWKKKLMAVAAVAVLAFAALPMPDSAAGQAQEAQPAEGVPEAQAAEDTQTAEGEQPAGSLPPGATEQTAQSFETKDGVLKKCTHVGEGGAVVVPDGITAIGPEAFSGYGVYDKLTSVIIPGSVKVIDNSAFSNCSKLESVTFSEGLEKIGNWAFYECSALTEITLPESVTTLEGAAFSNCTGLTSITIPAGVTSMAGSAFFGCSGLTSITVAEGNTVYDSRGCNAVIETASNTLVTGCKTTIIPDGITAIGAAAFRGQTGLETIAIPASVTSLGGDVFYDCSGLTSITIPDGVTEIKSCTFEGCSSLTSVSLPDSVTKIALFAFQDCTALTDIKLPGKLTLIDSSAFQRCSSLSSIEIPDSVTKINQSAFGDCSSLKSAIIRSSDTSIGQNAFRGCSSELVIYGKQGSRAQNYAWNTGVTFKELSDASSGDTPSTGDPSADTSAAVESYVLDLSNGGAVVSKESFDVVLQENQTKDVVIRTENDVTFTFRAGTMKAVEGKDSYDFTATITREFDKVTGLPAQVTGSNFVQRVDYSYSGALPAEASIRIYVGRDRAGQTLYYSHLLSDSTVTLMQAAAVDADGYITVKQSHCSSYIVTSTDLKPVTQPAGSPAKGAGTPQTGDTATPGLYVLLALSAIGLMLAAGRKVARNA